MSSPPSYNDALKDDDKLFVTLEACQLHASLLHTFHSLRIRDISVEKMYLARAERRYLLWMDHVQEEQPNPDILPPIGKLLKPVYYHKLITLLIMTT